MSQGKPQTKHIGICGWSPAAHAVVRELQSDVIARRTRFKVTAIVPRGVSQGEASGIRQESFRDVSFFIGDATRADDLEKAGLADFDTLVILADRSDDGVSRYVDHRSLLIALAASDRMRDVGGSIHQVIEVIDSDNTDHFARVPNCDVVSVEEIAERLLAQAVVTQGITEVVQRLLTASDDSNEIYSVTPGPTWTGRTFLELLEACIVEEQPFIPIGVDVVQDSGERALTLNPMATSSRDASGRVGAGHVLREQDRVVLIAYDEPDLSLVPAAESDRGHA